MSALAFVLFGGVESIDGIVDSAGMQLLVNDLKALPGVTVKSYLWANSHQTYIDIMAAQSQKIALIGYSGGGFKATWIANGYYGDPRHYEPRPRIDLMCLLDPSPTWSMMVIRDNVKRAINFHNRTPLMLGLGGGVLVGPHVLQVDIAEQHLFVQFDTEIRARIVDEVRKLAA